MRDEGVPRRPGGLPHNFRSIADSGKTSGIGLSTCGGLSTRHWSFYICSGGDTADELFFRQFDLEFFQEFGVFVHFLA
jgi:hypothetical protein